MFDSYEIPPRGFSPAFFVVQFIVAPLGGLVFGMVAYVVMEELFRVKDSTLLGYLVFSIQGFILGYRLQAAFPRAVESGGRWVWIPPICNLAVWVYRELERGQGSQAAWFFSFPSTHGSDEGIAMVLITWPALASCFYSIGVHAASRPPHSSWGKRFRRAMAGNPDDSEQTEATIVDK